MIEEWRDVAGYEGVYEVSDLGRVRAASGRIKAPNRNKRGYVYCHLWKDGKEKLITIHSLVLTAFVGERPEGHVCRHLNGDKGDNRLENLTWGTVAENVADNYRLDVYPKGRDRWSAKLTEEQVTTIRFSSEPTSHLARRYGVSDSTVKEAREGVTWKHLPMKDSA